MATVQVFVPYVGRLDYLQETIRSLLQQTDPSWALVVSQDGAEEDSPAQWIEDLRDPRITLVVHERPLGIARQFQWCADQAAAPLTTIMGCDDRLLTNYVATVSALLQQPKDMVLMQPDVEVIDADGVQFLPLTDRVKSWIKPTRKGRVGPAQALFSLCIGNWTYFPAICWRTRDLKAFGFDLGLRTALDLDLLVRLFLAGKSMYVGEEVAFSYRRHESSASSLERRRGRFEEERMVYERLARSARDSGHPWIAGAAFSRPTSRLHQVLQRFPIYDPD